MKLNCKFGWLRKNAMQRRGSMRGWGREIFWLEYHEALRMKGFAEQYFRSQRPALPASVGPEDKGHSVL